MKLVGDLRKYSILTKLLPKECHLIPIEEEDTARKVHKDDIYIDRRFGRPCLGWSNGVCQDTRNLSEHLEFSVAVDLNRMSAIDYNED